MSFLTYGLNQQATYWMKTGINGFSEPTFAVPVTVICRWEDRTDKIITPTGADTLSRARVFLDQDMAIGDYLFLGDSVASDPRTVIGAYEIKDFRKSPSLDASDFERKAFLGATASGHS